MDRAHSMPSVVISAKSVELSPVSQFAAITWKNSISFLLNGQEIVVPNPDPDQLLSTYIRETAGLTGTKIGCAEGGCGACTVVLTSPSTAASRSLSGSSASSAVIKSVNSCLRPLCANDGAAITTVEGLGSVQSGLGREQQSLIDNNGTQCGFCAAGWVTNMHALNASTEGALTTQQIETYLDGNLCRCTGYMPILKAFKTFACCGDTTKCDTCDHRDLLSESTSSHCPDVEEIIPLMQDARRSAISTSAMASSSSSSSSSSSCATTSKRRSTPLGRARDQAYVDSFVPRPAACVTQLSIGDAREMSCSH